MKKLQLPFKLLLLLMTLSFSSCSSDDDNSDSNYTQPQTAEVSKTYNLDSNTADNISGTAKFIKNDNGTTTVEINVQNTPSNGMHPAHIHFNTAAETGGIAVALGEVDGSTGFLSKTFSALEDGTPVSYEDMLDFDGYINVHLSSTNIMTIVSQGDIGQNELTGTSKIYNFLTVNNSGVSGTAEFYERVNGEALAILDVTGTTAGTDHLAHIHMNDIATTGMVALTFNNVIGATGISKTNIFALNSGTSFGYSDILTYDGYINIHASTTNLDVVAQVNIGANESNTSGSTFTYDVTNSGATAYNFTGNGLNAASNPNFTFVRGNTYVFNLNTPGHPFYINSVQSTGTSNQYNSGVTGNGSVSGTLTFVVPMNAPNTLYYNCEFHGSMTGTITVTY